MNQKEEPSTYLFDKKDAEYYKNRYLNNCKTRGRYISSLYNQFVTLESKLKQIQDLEDQKDPYAKKSPNIINAIKTLNSCKRFIEDYNEILKLEMENLLSRDFEALVKDNMEKIRGIENEKGCKEI